MGFMMKAAAHAARGIGSSSRSNAAAAATAAARLVAQKLAEFCSLTANAEEHQCVQLRLQNEWRAARFAALRAAQEERQAYCAANPYEIGCMIHILLPILIGLILILIAWCCFCCSNNDDEDKYD